MKQKTLLPLLQAIRAEEIHSITVVWIGRLGDVIVATPFLRGLKERFPAARIRLLVSYRSAEVLSLIPFIDEGLVLGKLTEIIRHASLFYALFRPCDLVIDLNPSFSKTASLLCRMMRAPFKLSFEKTRAKEIYNYAVSRAEDEEPMLRRYERLAQALGAPYEPRLELSVSQDDRVQANQIFDSLPKRQGASFRILVHMGNFKRESSCWRGDFFTRLIKEILENTAVDVYCLAGPGEKQKTQEILNQAALSIPVISSVPLGVLAALMGKMNLFFCNTTGTTHLAIAVGTPTFAIHTGYTYAIWNTGGKKDYAFKSEDWNSCRDVPYEEIRIPLLEMIKNLQYPRI